MGRGYKHGGGSANKKVEPFYLINDGVLLGDYFTNVAGSATAINHQGGQCVFNVSATNTIIRFLLPANLDKYSKLVLKKFGMSGAQETIGFSTSDTNTSWGTWNPSFTATSMIDTELSINQNAPYLLARFQSNGLIGSMWLE